jgi:rhodanese-related sulfurtransferase
MSLVRPADIRRAWLCGDEIAVLDLREEDLFAKAHPLFAVNLPLSRLELEILDRVPRRDCPLVLYDEDGSLIEAAQQRVVWRLGSKRVISCSAT